MTQAQAASTTASSTTAAAEQAPRILFNKNIRVTGALIESLQESGLAEPWASSTRANDPVMAAAGRRSFLEPSGLLGDAYAQWLLEAAAERGMQLVYAGKEREVLGDWTSRYAEAGIALITPGSREVQQLLEEKAEFLAGWDEGILPAPRWREYGSLDSFEIARQELMEGPGTLLCTKPSRGIYASGFRMITPEPRPRAFLKGELYECSLMSMRELIGYAEKHAPLPRMLLMHTLEGDERSTDCAAWQGELLCAVTRRKSDSSQHIEDRPDLEEAARKVARKYGLSGIFNMQTREDRPGGAPNILEINARASGGLRYAMAAGADFIGLLVQAAMGRPVQRPSIRTGIEVTEHRTIHVYREGSHEADVHEVHEGRLQDSADQELHLGEGA